MTGSDDFNNLRLVEAEVYPEGSGSRQQLWGKFGGVAVDLVSLPSDT